MTDTDVTDVVDEPVAVPAIRVQLGCGTPVDGGPPEVITTVIPQYDDPYGRPLYPFPEVHDDAIFAAHPHTAHLAAGLANVPEESKAAVRRALIMGHLAHPSGVKSLPDHEAAVVLIHPGGAWATMGGASRVPDFVSCPDHPGLERFLAEYWDCPVGLPADVEERYTTRHGLGLYPAGSKPGPIDGAVMGHTTWGCLNQSLTMGMYTPYTGTFGTVGTATAATATTLTGSSESGPVHIANDCAGQLISVGPNASGTGSKVYGVIISNTSGGTPVYTVDRWYNPATPGGAAGTTPNATGFYQVLGGPPAPFVALSSDTTAFSFGGTAATADAPLITTLLTGEVATQPTGLVRKVGVITIGAHTWINTVTFTIQGGDTSLPFTVGKAALSPSIMPAAANGGALTYMTLVTPTAVLSAAGDALTLTWTFTETNT